MTNLVKGRSEDPDLLTQKEAAEWLSVPARMVRRLVEQRLLTPARARGQQVWFRPEDVVNVARSLSRGVTLTGVAHQALQALSIAQRTEQRLDDVLEALGGKYRILSTDPDDMQHLVQALEVITENVHPKLRADQIYEWARTFMSVNRAYLLLVQQLTGRRQPWRIFLDAVDVIFTGVTQQDLDRDAALSTACSLLEGARRSVRLEAYFLCQDLVGAKETQRLFPDQSGQDVNDKILSLLRTGRSASCGT